MDFISAILDLVNVLGGIILILSPFIILGYVVLMIVKAVKEKK